MRVKRMLTLLLALAMVLSLAACGGSGEGTGSAGLDLEAASWAEIVEAARAPPSPSTAGAAMRTETTG